MQAHTVSFPVSRTGTSVRTLDADQYDVDETPNKSTQINDVFAPNQDETRGTISASTSRADTINEDTSKNQRIGRENSFLSEESIEKILGSVKKMEEREKGSIEDVEMIVEDQSMSGRQIQNKIMHMSIGDGISSSEIASTGLLNTTERRTMLKLITPDLGRILKSKMFADTPFYAKLFDNSMKSKNTIEDKSRMTNTLNLEENEEMDKMEKDIQPGSDDSDVVSTGSEDWNRLDKELMRAFSKTEDLRNDYKSFLNEKIKRLSKIVRLYNENYHTLNLDAMNAEQYWSEERSTIEHHRKRFTRMDTAMAEAWVNLTKRELYSMDRGGFCGLAFNEVDYCKRRCQLMEIEVDKKSSTRSGWFSFEKFSLLDILERQDDKDELFFSMAMRDMPDEKQGGVPQLFDVFDALEQIKDALTRHGHRWRPIMTELTRSQENNYTLPKGKLYCQLLFNIAELLFYDSRNYRWCCEPFDDNLVEKIVFRGIPFNDQGRVYRFDATVEENNKN